MKLPFLIKYKPVYFDDYVKQEEVTNFLKILITSDNINTLLVGNSGTGKTTLINSIIREYYKDCTNTPEDIQSNILYINSLKDQGIHYYRNDVKTFCQTSSSINGKKKFVILDDLDNINEQSQQVFRNCIDKYGSNVNFIASCLNLQKVIDSIQSRIFIIKLKTHSFEKLMTILEMIITKENIEMDDKCKKKLVLISNYSVRILINYLEKIKLLDEPVSESIIEELCSNICYLDFSKYLSYCLNNKDLHKASQLFLSIYDKGYSVIDILNNFFIYIKSCDDLTETQKYNLLPVICKYITIFYNIHEDEIELVLFTNTIIEVLKQ